MRPFFQVLLATYCIIQGIRVDWCGLIFKAMELCVKYGGRDIYFPRLLSRLVKKIDMPIPLKPHTTCKLMRFQASSFNVRYVNQFMLINVNSDDFQSSVLENRRRINDLQEQFRHMLENNVRMLDEHTAHTQRLLDLQEIVRRIQQAMYSQEEQHMGFVLQNIRLEQTRRRPPTPRLEPSLPSTSDLHLPEYDPFARTGGED